MSAKSAATTEESFAFYKDEVPDCIIAEDAAKLILADLNGASYDQLCLDKTEAPLVARRVEIAAAEVKLDEAERAHRAAVAKDARALQWRRAQLAQVQVNAVIQHLAARRKAASDMVAGLTIACAAWKILIHRSSKAVAANPVGGSWPTASMCDFPSLKKAVETELYRLGGDGESLSNAHSFPGGSASVDFCHRPNDLPVLCDVLAETDRYVLAKIQGLDVPVTKSPPAIVEPAADVGAGVDPNAPTLSADQIAATLGPARRLPGTGGGDEGRARK